MHLKLFKAILDHVFCTLGLFFFIYIPYIRGRGVDKSMEISILFLHPSLSMSLKFESASMRFQQGQRVRRCVFIAVS